MGRKKRTSKILDKANVRAAGLRSIGTHDFGNGLTSAAFEKANLLADSEKTLRDYHERVLAGVGAKFGKNSNEYEKVGGVRKSERKRPTARKSASKSPA